MSESPNRFELLSIPASRQPVSLLSVDCALLYDKPGNHHTLGRPAYLNDRTGGADGAIGFIGAGEYD